jgi:hypothetical protein
MATPNMAMATDFLKGLLQANALASSPDPNGFQQRYRVVP